jgi:hypothetical protein
MLKAIDNRVLREIIGPKRREGIGTGENCAVKRSVLLTKCY